MNKAVIIASGPSLTQEDVDRVWRWRACSPQFHVVVVTNNIFRMAPWADYCYAADFDWIRRFEREVRMTLVGELVSGDSRAHKKWDHIRHVPRDEGDTLCEEGFRIPTGGSHGNSGYQALCFAAKLGCNEIVLLGFDHAHKNGQTHCHGDHPEPMANAANPHHWVEAMGVLAPQLAARGVVVKNASRETALNCFPRVSIAESLGC